MRSFIGLSLLMALSACWEAEQFEVLRVVPGVICLPGAQVVAVGEIAGPYGDAAGHMLAEGLMGLQRFDVLDWSAPFGGSGGRGGWASAQGDWHAADAAFLGAISEPILAPSYDTEVSRGADGSMLVTYVRTMTLQITGYFRIIDPHNGLIISSEQLTTRSTGPAERVTLRGAESDFDSRNMAQYFAPIAVDALHLEAVRGLTDALVDLVAFTYSPTKVMLYHDRHSKEMVHAIEEAKRGQWKEAVQLYAQAAMDLNLHAPSQAYMGHYNHGVALAFSGELARGIEEVEVALSLQNTRMIKNTLADLRRYQDESLQRQARNQVRR